MAGSESRSGPRSTPILRIKLKPTEFTRIFEKYTRNLGKGGVFVRAESPLPVDTHIQFEIHVTDQQDPVCGQARIAWVRTPEQALQGKPAGMGVQFIEVDERSQKVIDTLIKGDDKAESGFLADDLSDPSFIEEVPPPPVQEAAPPPPAESAPPPPDVPVPPDVPPPPVDTMEEGSNDVSSEDSTANVELEPAADSMMDMFSGASTTEQAAEPQEDAPFNLLDELASSSDVSDDKNADEAPLELAEAMDEAIELDDAVADDEVLQLETEAVEDPMQTSAENADNVVQLDEEAADDVMELDDIAIAEVADDADVEDGDIVEAIEEVDESGFGDMIQDLDNAQVVDEPTREFPANGDEDVFQALETFGDSSSDAAATSEATIDESVQEASSTASKNNGSGQAAEVATLPMGYSVTDTIIGIDLGTSNSCVAVIKEGKPVVIASSNNETTIPSVVCFSKKANNEVIVGKLAREQAAIDPANTVYGAKRFVGRPYNSPVVQRLKDSFPYDVIPGDKGQTAIRVREQVVSLEQIQAYILDTIKHVAQEFVGLEVTKAVITVPAYYNDNQRQAVKDAGRLAGLDVERIVNEPTAAALAYGFNRGFRTRILIYDLGGGTFDVSILELNGNRFDVLASGGNNFLGGEDFDNSIADYIMKTYERDQNIRFSDSAIIRERVKQAAEFAKRHLSEVQETTINVPYLKTMDDQNVNVQMKLDRATVNKLTMHLVDRTLELCDEVIRAGGLKKGDFDELILVGGQTRMPLIANKIRQHFSQQPRSGINPDEVVALGAALLGGSIGQDETVQLRDVISISIGIALPGGRFKPIIKRNMPLPFEKTYKIGTKPGQESFSIDIFQGEGNFVKDNEYLGTLLFSDLPVGSKDSIKLNIKFEVNEECLLKVIAENPQTGAKEEALLVTYDTPKSLKEAIADKVNQDADGADL